MRGKDGSMSGTDEVVYDSTYKVYAAVVVGHFIWLFSRPVEQQG